MEVVVILKVFEGNPGETLDIVVGAGGDAGVHGTLIPNKILYRRQVRCWHSLWRRTGGNGYASNGAWAAGGGGGFSAIFRNGPWGKETILVAGGGGGGGSRNGCPGGGFEGGQTADDPRNGKGGTQEEGGEGGHFPLNENWSWDGNENNIIGKDGEQWQGGDGSIFGAGGGGGFFGGGGGGSTPGIVGGGGGGSSFANDDVKHVVTLLGEGDKPGGMNRKPPTAVGIGEWDPIEGMLGRVALQMKKSLSEVEMVVSSLGHQDSISWIDANKKCITKSKDYLLHVYIFFVIKLSSVWLFETPLYTCRI